MLHHPITGRSDLRRLLAAQGALAALVACGFALQGWASALAALYGGGIALLNGLLLGWRVRRANSDLRQSAQANMFSMYLGALERFAVALIGMGVGMGVLHLAPVALLVAFAVAHVGYPIAAAQSARTTG